MIDPCRLGSPASYRKGPAQQAADLSKASPPEGWDDRGCMEDRFLQPACLKGVHFF